jgi:TRAP-type C4-dicarboxylate transport system permease small subunit
MEENQSVFDLQVDQTASQNLLGTARWAKFLSVVAFVCMGLFLILFLSLQSQLSRSFSELIPGLGASEGLGIILVVLIIVIGIVGLLMYFLLRAATHIKGGILTNNQQQFNAGLGYLKSYFTMYGIIAIIGLIFKILGLFSK